MLKLLLALFFFPNFIFAQAFPVDPQTGKITYTEDLLIKDASQTELFERAKGWIVSSSDKAAGLLIDDASNGFLKATKFTALGTAEGNGRDKNKLWFTVTIRAEDDRFWYSLSDFHLQRDNYAPVPASNEAQARKQPLESLVIPEKTEGKKEVDAALALKAKERIHGLVEGMKASLY